MQLVGWDGAARSGGAGLNEGVDRLGRANHSPQRLITIVHLIAGDLKRLPAFAEPNRKSAQGHYCDAPHRSRHQTAPDTKQYRVVLYSPSTAE